jgi:hypothetical protein
VLGIVLIQYFEYLWKSLGQTRTFREKVFKEELLNGNKEEGCKEDEESREEETLTNQRG